MDQPPIENPDQRILEALQETRVVRQPRQTLATFGVTRLHYHLLTEPSYADVLPSEPETVVREGIVVAERPAIVTPAYMMNLEGFGDEARRSLDLLSMRLGSQSPGVMYTYKNEPTALTILAGRVDAVSDRISSELDREGEHLATVIVGTDALWDVSLLRFIYEYTANSVVQNVQQLRGHGLLDPDPNLGIPKGAIQQVEELFQAAERGNADPAALKMELDRWDLFDRYEDRFLALFRRRLL